MLKTVRFESGAAVGVVSYNWRFESVNDSWTTID